jgi:hypothetical protein
VVGQEVVLQVLLLHHHLLRRDLQVCLGLLRVEQEVPL